MNKKIFFWHGDYIILQFLGGISIWTLTLSCKKQMTKEIKKIIRE